MVDVIIVLGDYVDENGISEELKTRIDRGIELLDQKDAKYILFCGGFGEHFNKTKLSLAEHMKEYAIGKGVSSSNVLLENESFNTIENLMFAKNILKERGLKDIIVVTSDWHMERAKLIASYVFRDNQSVSYSSVKVEKSNNPQVWEWEIASRERDKKKLEELKENGKLN